MNDNTVRKIITGLNQWEKCRRNFLPGEFYLFINNRNYGVMDPVNGSEFTIPENIHYIEIKTYQGILLAYFRLKYDKKKQLNTLISGRHKFSLDITISHSASVIRLKHEGIEKNLFYYKVKEIFGKIGEWPYLQAGSYAYTAIALFIITGIIFLQKENLNRFTGTVETDKSSGMKGAITETEKINLQFLVDKKTDKGNTLEKGVDNSLYSGNDAVSLRYSIAEDGYVYLLLLTSTGKTEILYPSDFSNQALLKRGIYDFEKGGIMQGIKLMGLKGKNHFLALYSKDVINLEGINSIIKKDINDFKAFSLPQTEFSFFTVYVDS